MPMTILGVNCGEEKALPGLCLEKAELFASAHIIAASPHLLASIKGTFSAQLMPLELPIRPFLSAMGAASESGKNVLILASGDPLFFGLASSLAEMAANWRYDIIPAVSSLQAACARLALPWANIAVLSLHGRKDLSPVYRILSSRQNFCLLTGTESDSAWLARFMIDRGYDNYEVNCFENMGSEHEKISKLALADCAHTRFSSNTLSLFICKKKERTEPALTMQGHLMGSYCTPATRRGQILELLDIMDSDLIWDIGAGSGLMSHELARRASCGEVWAVEEKSSRALDIQYNRQLLACPNLKLALGHAPDILKNLPAPSRIFIGGGLSSPDAPLLLDFCLDRLVPGGRIVITCILLENLQKCLNHPGFVDCALEFFQTQMSRGAPLGKGFRFIAENPAFLIKIGKRKSG